MIKQIKELAKTNNLTIDAKGNIAYGYYGGKFISIWENVNNQAAHCVKLWAKTSDFVTGDAILQYGQQLRAKYGFLANIAYDGKVITAQFQAKGFGWAKKYLPQLEGYLKDMMGFLASYTLELSCEGCNTWNDLSLYQFNGVPHLVCPACLARVGQQATQNKAEFKAQGQGNVLFGIVGSFLGALLGVLVWVLIYQAGYISVLGAMALVVCAFKGYELMGGHMTKLGIAISCIVSVIMLLFAEQICLAILIYQAYHTDMDITFFEAFRIVPYFLTDPEFLRAVIPDVLLGGICVIVGGIATGIQTYKEKTGAIASRMIAKITGNS